MSTLITNKESVQYSASVWMETIICYKCAIPFAVPSNYREYLKDTGESFHCPNGHSQQYTKSTVDRLKEKLEEEKARAERLQKTIDWKNETINAIERQKSAIKGQVTKIKNRIKNGVCPCCNRTFENLAKHMKSQHPDFSH